MVTQGLELCLENINNWMNSNRFKVNNDKTEYMCIRSRQQVTKCITQEINVIETAVKRMELIHCLGSIMDTNLTFKNHTTHICKKVMIDLQRIKLIRVCLTNKTTETLVLSWVTSHLDYANAILASLPENTTKSCKQYITWLQNLSWMTRRMTAILRTSKHYTGCL